MVLTPLNRIWNAAITILAAESQNSTVHNNLFLENNNVLPTVRESIEVLPPPYQNVIGSPCVMPLFTHEFAFSYGQPFVKNFTAPTCSDDYTKVYLKWEAFCPKGTQFDRIAAVWINGVELLRTSTQEPRKSYGVEWQVVRDVTAYYDVIMQGGTVVASLDNIVNSVYTSSFTITVSAEFFVPSDPTSALKKPDQVLPVSASSTSYGWFRVQPSSTQNTIMESALPKILPESIKSEDFLNLVDLGVNSIVAAATQGSFVTVPPNTEEIYLEVFLSFHECDEFWYTNSKSDTSCASGSFREVQVLVDDNLVGTIWPFPVIFTGGINPLLHNPIVATGAFLLPTYTLNLTPFLGLFLDSKPHKISFSVDYGLNFWLIDGNLLVYLDKNGNQTVTNVLNKQIAPQATFKEKTTNKGYTVVTTTASRLFYVQSAVTTSKGTKIYTVDDTFKFSNIQKSKVEVGPNATSYFQSVEMETVINRVNFVDFMPQSKRAVVAYEESYPLMIQYFVIENNDNSFYLATNVSTGFYRSSDVTEDDTAYFQHGFTSSILSTKWKGSAWLASGVGGSGKTGSSLIYQTPTTGCFTRAAAADGGLVRSDINNTYPYGSTECYVAL
jgi:hypothetical protein